MKLKPYEDDKLVVSVGESPHPDTFNLSMAPDGKTMRVRRSDSELGWGQNLSLSVLDKVHGRHKTVCVGSSEINEVSVSVGFNEIIPRNVYLCYKNKKIPEFVFRDIKLLNPAHEVSLFDDDDCRQFIKENIGVDAAECFSWIPNGSIKADFWRACILLQNGGIYFDIDVHHKVGIDDYLDSEATFLTSTSVTPAHMNPIVLMSKAGSPVLELCAYVYIERFKRKIPYHYWGWSICGTMFKAIKRVLGREINNDFSDMVRHEGETYQFVNEDKSLGTRGGYFTHFKGEKILNNHHVNYVESPKYKGFKPDQKCFEDQTYKVEVVEHPFLDIFEIRVEGRSIRISRVDEDAGWGQNLVLKVTKKSTGQERLVEVGPSSTNHRSVEISMWNKHGEGAKGRKMLFVVAGEAFRHGQHGRDRDTDESYDAQRKASLSHVDLMDHLSERWGLGCDVMVSSYHTIFIKELLGWYGPRLLASSFKSGLVGLEPLVRDALGEVDLWAYESVFVSRVDIEFKPYLKKVFDPSWDRIMFPSICWAFQGYITAAPAWVPRVSDVMEFVPKRLIESVRSGFHLRHEAWFNYRKDGLAEKDLGLMLDTFHDSDSAKDYNPLYRMASRRDSKKWYSPNLHVAPDRSPKRCFSYIGYPDWAPAVTEPYEDEDLLISYRYDCYVRSERFSISFDRESRQIKVRRLDYEGGWDVKVILTVRHKGSGEEREVFVGKSAESEKTVMIDYRPNQFEDEQVCVTVKDHEFADVFHLHRVGDGEISVMRIDEVAGWGQDLSLVVREKSTGRSKLVKVGPSQDQKRTVGLKFGFRTAYAPARVALCIRGAVSRKCGPSPMRGDIYAPPGGYVDYESVYRSVEKHIIQANPKTRFDVFLHSWNKDLCANLECLYRPSASLFEDNETYADEILSRCEGPRDFSGVSHALSIKRAIQLKEEYERTKGISYDMVVLYRPDVLIWKDMDLSLYDVSEGIFVNAHPNFGGHFHFVMSSEDASVFKGLYDSPLRGNQHKAHHWIKSFVDRFMERPMFMDDIVPSRDQEVARPDKMRASPVNIYKVGIETLSRYGVRAEDI